MMIVTAMKDTTFDSFFLPRSIAVIGASTNPAKVGAIVLRNILESGFPGEVYPVNPKGGMIEGLMVYERVTDIPSIPGLAVIATPSVTVLPLVEELGEKGVENVLILSAGFGESGPQGRVLEDTLKQALSKWHMRMLGPNCMGFVDNRKPLNTTFGQLMRKKGNLLLLSQSGAMASSIFDWCSVTEIGLAGAVTLGNKTDITENDVLGYWEHAKLKPLDTRVGMSPLMPIGMYLESISAGERFVEVCRKLAVNHPMFLLKPGKSSAAKKAMQSHTGSLAGEDVVLDAALSRAGVIRCEGIQDFFDLAKVFSFENPPQGSRVAVLSNAGGPAVVTADTIASYGLSMAELSSGTTEILTRLMPREAALTNPIDVLGDAMADRYKMALTAVLNEPRVDGVVVLLTPQVMTQIEETAEVIGKLSYQHKKPILCAFIGGSRVAAGEKILNGYKIPVFRYPERAIYAFSMMWEWQKNRKSITKAIKPAKKIAADLLYDFEQYGTVLNILKKFEVRTPPMVRVTSMIQAIDFWRRHKQVVFKIISPTLMHKKEVGGVMTHIETRQAVEDGYKTMLKRIEKINKNSNVASLYVQKQVSLGVELLVGIKTDDSFGPVMTLAAGGSMAELLMDKQVGLLGGGENEIRRMLQRLKIYQLLSGFRGEKAYDIKDLVKQIKNFERMVVENGIFEAEVNPLIVNRQGVWAVDVKIIS